MSSIQCIINRGQFLKKGFELPRKNQSSLPLDILKIIFKSNPMQKEEEATKLWHKARMLSREWKAAVALLTQGYFCLTDFPSIKNLDKALAIVEEYKEYINIVKLVERNFSVFNAIAEMKPDLKILSIHNFEFEMNYMNIENLLKFCNLSYLEINDGHYKGSVIDTPISFSSLNQLKVLLLKGQSLAFDPSDPLPSSLETIRISNCFIQSQPLPGGDLGKLKLLEFVNSYHQKEFPPQYFDSALALTCLSIESHLQVPKIEKLTNLQELRLTGSFQTPPSLAGFTKLRKFSLVETSYTLKNWPCIQSLTDLTELHLQGSFTELRDFSTLVNLEVLSINAPVKNLSLARQKKLRIIILQQVQEIPSLTHLIALETLIIKNCNAQGLASLNPLQNLENISLLYCSHLKKLPNMSELRKLKNLYYSDPITIKDEEIDHLAGQNPGFKCYKRVKQNRSNGHYPKK